MYDAALKIKRYTKDMDFSSFANDDKTIDAVIRNFEIIGEAANRIAPDYKFKNPELEWNHLKGFRNRIVHEYFGVDYEIVWSIIENNLDNYIEWIEVLLNKEKSN
ncbi:MAG TPA: DUF86 domain-containing protein [Bacteroidales bacterium]|nr:DUF86 domain-containing protein [Bacteroidales bacterium]